MADKLSRRGFLGAGAAGAAALMGAESVSAAQRADRLPQRVLGRTNERVPILGLGTVALGSLENQKQAGDLLNRALDLGVTFIDTAPGRTSVTPITGYSRAQRYLAGVLRERRKEVFLITKTYEHTGERALQTLRASLKELGVERVDLTYTHSIGHDDYDFDQLVGDKGPMTALERARRDGLTRFVGITGHNRPEKFARVIARRQIDVMMNAVNVVDRHTYAFEDVVWPAARKQNVGLVAMKVFGGGIKTCRMPAELRQASFRFALSVPGVAVAVIGMGSRKELEQNVEWARGFKPMTREEANELKKRTVALAKEWGPHLDRLDRRGERTRPLVNT
jgi:aryl-alcohol dehydrogenase-like predicted oxidoreductase